MSVIAYVSGHGFGHWTRSEPLLQALSEQAEVHVRTSGRALGPAKRASWASSVVDVDVGPGVSQRGPLAVDVPLTKRLLSEHLNRWPELIASEVEAGRELGARMAFADVPPLAFVVAERLGVPSLGMANFTWSWAYAHYAQRDPFFKDAAARLAEAEGLATRAIYLPGGGGLETLGPPALEAALRRPPTCSPSEAKQRLPRPPGREHLPLVLLSFGGYGDALDLSQAARANPSHAFVSFSQPSEPPPDNLLVLPHDHDLPHQDLVLGADALIAKPGYGTISECLERPTPFVYVIPGEGFREHRRLEEMVQRWLPNASLTPEQLLAGDWGAALERAIGATPAEPPPPRGLGQAIALARGMLNGL